MKRLVMTDFNKLELQEAPIPEPGAEEAVVRVQYAGICSSDMHIIAGEHPTARPPFVMGHEMCGEVCAINSARRTDIKPGDKVTIHAVKGCGVCDMCRAGRENLCRHIDIMGAGCDGFFSEYVLCRADRLIRFREDVDMRIAALAEPLTIAVHDVRRSGLQAGEDVFIAGAGPIGMLIASVARLSGAAHVVMAELDETRLRLARDMGFTAINPKEPDFQAVCDALTGGKGFDKLFEVTSVQAGFDMCLGQIKRGGTMVQVGMPGSGRFEGGFDANAIIFNEATYMGVRNSSSRSMMAAVKMINDGQLDGVLRGIVSAIYPKERAIEGFRRVREDRSVLKVLIDFS